MGMSNLNVTGKNTKECILKCCIFNLTFIGIAVQAAQLGFDSNRAAEFFYTTKFYSPLIYRDQGPTVPLWKYLNPVVNLFSFQETGSIFKIIFAHSKRLHVHSALYQGCDIYFRKLYLYLIEIIPYAISFYYLFIFKKCF